MKKQLYYTVAILLLQMIDCLNDNKIIEEFEFSIVYYCSSFNGGLGCLALVFFAPQ